jgi:hypothetical protein
VTLAREAHPKPRGFGLPNVSKGVPPGHIGWLKCLSVHSDNRVKKIGIRNYSSQEATNNNINKEISTVAPEKYYEDIYAMKQLILKENKNKSGI